MIRRLGIFALLLASILFVSGCGGSGDSEASNPDGTFSLGFSPNVDGGIAHSMAIELEADGGEIIDGYAQFVDSDLIGYYTTDVTGTASEGFIEAVCTFSTFEVHIDAVYSGLQWHGTYQVVEGAKVIEEGDLTVTRTGAATPDISGFWEGIIPDDGIGFELEILQKGNDLAVDAIIDGIDYTGGGSVVGRSVSIYLDEVLDGSDLWLVGTLNGDADAMTGEGIGKGTFTFSLERIVVRPKAGSTAKSN